MADKNFASQKKPSKPQVKAQPAQQCGNPPKQQAAGKPQQTVKRTGQGCCG